MSQRLALHVDCIPADGNCQHVERLKLCELLTGRVRPGADFQMEAPGLHEVKVSALLEALRYEHSKSRPSNHPTISLVAVHETLIAEGSRRPSKIPSTPACSLATRSGPDEHAQRGETKRHIPALLGSDDLGRTRAGRSGVAESINIEVEVWSTESVHACQCLLNTTSASCVRSTTIIS